MVVQIWVPLQGYPDVPFETCHITRVHDLLILYVGSKSFAEPTAFHHLDEPQGWGYFQHPLRGTNSPQRTLRWSHSMGGFKGFQCKIYKSRIFPHAFGVGVGVVYETPFSSTQVYSYRKKTGNFQVSPNFHFWIFKILSNKKTPRIRSLPYTIHTFWSSLFTFNPTTVISIYP